MEHDSVQVLRIGLRQVEVAEYVREDASLWTSPLLAPLRPEQREALLRGAHARVAAADEPILTAQQTSALYLILGGAVVLSTGADGAGLTTLGKGDFFGLSGVLDGAPALAAAADHAGARLAVLPAASVRALAAEVAELHRLLVDTARRRQALASACADFLDRW
ncbi:MAG TPA: cyclic nucleotide-binding domain-containing protein [Myxococcota bacterium]|nr:cyclic nucleotide-binding domain-containing protein [Myxococcota bacterium]HRY95448.1 cyclic nucleotide-binding domain-containing protein [Myxococcota bacterium]HSA23442.1 cyclic nucleotide-binding domain-containing protein [Myxococcota bacterium]